MLQVLLACKYFILFSFLQLGLEPLPNVTLSDVDKEGPLSTVPIPVENDVLKFCLWYLLATGTICFFYYLSPIKFIRTLWTRPKTD